MPKKEIVQFTTLLKLQYLVPQIIIILISPSSKAFITAQGRACTALSYGSYYFLTLKQWQ
jgi:hypothetical protein